MAKKQRERSEVEKLRGEVRELLKLNKELKRSLSRAKKHQRDVTDLEELLQEEQEKEYIPPVKKCPECKVGNLKQTDIGVRILDVCECGYKKARKL